MADERDGDWTKAHERLAELLRPPQWSQRKLAKEADVSNMTICNIANGVMPSERMQEALERIVGIPRDWWTVPAKPPTKVA